MPENKGKLEYGSCPECGAEKLLRSRRKGVKERLMKLFGKDVRFYRCHQCHARFKKKGEAGLPVKIK
jgi:uncharacterized protein with PIN domain